MLILCNLILKIFLTVCQIWSVSQKLLGRLLTQQDQENFWKLKEKIFSLVGEKLDLKEKFGLRQNLDLWVDSGLDLIFQNWGWNKSFSQNSSTKVFRWKYNKKLPRHVLKCICIFISELELNLCLQDIFSGFLNESAYTGMSMSIGTTVWASLFIWKGFEPGSWCQCSTAWANTPTLNWETFLIGNSSGTDGRGKKASVAFPTFNYSGLISLRPNEPNYRIKLPTHFIQTQLFYIITLNQATRMWTNCR